MEDCVSAGEIFYVMSSEKDAKSLLAEREDFLREKKDKKVMTSESAFQMLDQEKINKMRIIIKSDVAGTSEAIVHSLAKLGNDEVEVDVVFSGVGGITESDVNLAATTNSKVIGFNVRSDNNAKKVSEDLGIEISYYSVIYDLIEDVNRLLSGLLEPIFSEKILGLAQVKEVFKSSEFGMVAGCIITEGSVKREKHVRVLRDNVVWRAVVAHTSTNDNAPAAGASFWQRADVCGKLLQSCKLRYQAIGATTATGNDFIPSTELSTKAVLPFGAFPGTRKFR